MRYVLREQKDSQCQLLALLTSYSNPLYSLPSTNSVYVRDCRVFPLPLNHSPFFSQRAALRVFVSSAFITGESWDQ